MRKRHEFPWYLGLIANFIEWVEKLIYKKKWSYRDQVYFAFNLIEQDARWMAHDENVSKVSERHLGALKPTWQVQRYTEISEFRNSLGLNPHIKKPKSK